MDIGVIGKIEGKSLLKWMLVLLLAGILAWQIVHLVDPATASVDDFVEYWAAGRLNLTGGNPYAPEQLRALQVEVGLSEDSAAIVMWNPPWTLTVVMPFGLLSYPTGRLLWLGLHFALILACADWAWRFYGGPVRRRWLAWIVAITFAPSLFVLNMGQIGTLILLGVVGFLYFSEKEQWWLAGASAALIAIKPHLLYLFWAALLLWALSRRRWPVLLGGGLTGLAATAIPLAINPGVISQYLQALMSEPPFYWASPTLGSVLRLLFGLDRHWLQFLPSVVGLVWFTLHWRTHRHTWNWRDQMPLLLLVSIVTTSYGWEFDQVVLLLAVMQAAVWVFNHDRRAVKGLVLTAHLTITILAMAVNIVVGDAFWYVWLAPAFLVGYLILRRWLGQDVRLDAKHVTAHPVVEGVQPAH